MLLLAISGAEVSDAATLVPIGAKNKVEHQTKYAVARGNWGGQSVSLVVEKNAVTIEFDCAEGEIPRQLKTDKKGNFSVTGTFTRHMPGPLRRDNMPQPEPARYEGKVTGKLMKLKITLLKTNEAAGEFTIEQGHQPMMTRCL
jgi:hypothetical protein